MRVLLFPYAYALLSSLHAQMSVIRKHATELVCEREASRKNFPNLHAIVRFCLTHCCYATSTRSCCAAFGLASSNRFMCLFCTRSLSQLHSLHCRIIESKFRCSAQSPLHSLHSDVLARWPCYRDRDGSWLARLLSLRSEPELTYDAQMCRRSVCPIVVTRSSFVETRRCCNEKIWLTVPITT